VLRPIQAPFVACSHDKCEQRKPALQRGLRRGLGQDVEKRQRRVRVAEMLGIVPPVEVGQDLPVIRRELRWIRIRLGQQFVC
jgi:hypothetical protein